jgi:hypothetical protein
MARKARATAHGLPTPLATQSASWVKVLFTCPLQTLSL